MKLWLRPSLRRGLFDYEWKITIHCWLPITRRRRTIFCMEWGFWRMILPPIKPASDFWPFTVLYRWMMPSWLALQVSETNQKTILQLLVSSKESAINWKRKSFDLGSIEQNYCRITQFRKPVKATTGVTYHGIKQLLNCLTTLMQLVTSIVH